MGRAGKIVRWAAAGVMGACALAGCSDPLLTEDEPRSQYDLTDAARDRRAPTYVWNNKEERKPNIRGRVLSGAE